MYLEGLRTRVTIMVIHCRHRARVPRAKVIQMENPKLPTEAGLSPWIGFPERKRRRKEGNFTSGTEEEIPTKPTPTKNLRFFGDTDIESNDSVRRKSALRSRPGITAKDRLRSQSSRDLHNISEELLRSSDLNVKPSSYKSMTNIPESTREIKGSHTNLKPPMSPNHRTRDISRHMDDRDMSRRKKNEVSSAESSTEGDSQQSQRSIVYLHAATVGDIPGPGNLRNGRRTASREELASNSSTPWKPKHLREAMDIDYTQYPKPTKNSKYEQKIMKNPPSRKDKSSTLKKNITKIKEELPRGSNFTLYKKKERLPRENIRYNRDDKKIASKSLSVESLGRPGRKSRDERRDVSRSVSMPRDPKKSAGWFKSNNKMSGSSQRL
ncbi:hypothetical protein NQ317_011897 [Molorchus minor]|uniref:Uncharacterized protein n=1 Tax=Molorchus minor TaxID=1323400 RepID=A0ABQ9IYG4_9CUCU|nr:hypothetical protein NQ317_011897 [Molorchus minor]